RVVLVGRVRLRRTNRRAEPEARAVAALLARDARVLETRPEVELVARRRLPRQTDVPLLPDAVVDRLLALVGVVRPRVRVAGVLVDPHARNALPAEQVAERPEEPELVADDRTTERRIDFPEFPDVTGRGESLRDDVGGEVAALERAARAADEEAAGEDVAALLADDVHLRAAGGRFAEAAAQAEHDFLRVADFRHIARHAHALVAAVHAVDEHLAFVAAAAVDLKHAVERGVGAFEVVLLDVDRGNEMRERR